MRDTGRYHDERVMRRHDGDLFWCRVRGQSLTPENPFQRGIWSFADLSEERPIVELTQREREGGDPDVSGFDEQRGRA